VLLPVAKPSNPHPIEHFNIGACRTMSSLDTHQTLTWVEKHVFTATDWGVGRMNVDEGRGDPK
jgi:hypothetical protein